LKKPERKRRVRPSDSLRYVVENGVQFIERGVNELWNTDDKAHLKHSVINFYSGVELLLKARLMMEHWALIVLETQKADTEKFLSGDFRSVGLNDAVSRLKNIASLDFPLEAHKAFQKLQNHRNQMVHFFHSADLRTKEGRDLKSQVIREQCLGWFHLRNLLSDKWSMEFQAYQSRVLNIEKSMKRHQEYLGTVYEQIKSELDIAAKGGAVLGYCHTCHFSAHVIDEIGPSESHCRVCTAYRSCLSHKCINCNFLFTLEEGNENASCPKCSSLILIDDLMEKYSGEGQMLPKDFLTEGGYGNCAECGGYHKVGTIGDQSFCFSCFQFQAPMGVCGWCSEKATGDLEMSYYSGCVMCDGHGDWDRD
jgi:DNA-directed RNA polymerase subunit RPC12/RpoP